MCKAPTAPAPTTANRLTKYEEMAKTDTLRRSPEELALTVALMKSEGHKRVLAIIRTAEKLQASIDALVKDHGPETDSLLAQYLQTTGSGGFWLDLEVLHYNTGVGAGIVGSVIPGAK